MNQEAYDTLFYWINERHRIFINKEEGKAWPWTTDPILQEWKFCNPFRKNDRQSRLLIEKVINLHRSSDPDLLLFNIFLFRAFNLYDTYRILGWQSNFRGEIAKDKLYAHVSEGGKLTSGAYMIRGREGIAKYESIIQTLDEIWDSKELIINRINGNHSLENAFDVISRMHFWGWGPFTIYQVLLDLTYTPILQDPGDINSWCVFGPGAGRGINLIYPGTRKDQYLTAAKQLLRDSMSHLEKHVPDMTLQDIEFSLCELQKYWRIKNGGKSKERYAKQSQNN